MNADPLLRAGDPTPHRSPVSRIRPVLVLGAVGALIAPFAHARPTGTRPVDILWLGCFGGLLVLAAGRSRRSALALSCVFATSASIGENPTALVAAVVLALALGSAASSQRRSWLNAVCGVGLVHVVLHLAPDRPVWSSALWFVAIVGPIGVSALRHAPRSQRRRAQTVGAILIAATAVMTIGTATTAIRTRHDLAGGEAAARAAASTALSNPEATLVELQRANRHFARAERSLTSPWIRPATVVPGLAQNLAVLQSGASQATAMTGQASAALATYVATMAQADKNNGLDLSRIGALGPTLIDLDRTVRAASDHLVAAESPWLVPPLRDPLRIANEQLKSVALATANVADAAQFAPRLLGSEEPTRWFVGVTNPAESRFLGGFLASYLVLQVDDGDLRVTASGSTGELVDSSGLANRTLSGPPEFLARYGSRYQPTRYFQNLTASPLAASNAQVITELFPQTGGGPIDGVLFLDPVAIEALVRLIGRPLPLPGTTTVLDGATTADHLIRDQYLEGDPADVASRRDQLDSIALAMVDMLTEEMPPAVALARAVGDMVRGGHLSIHAAEPAANQLLERSGLTGGRPTVRSPDGPDDVLSVRSANAGRNKLDIFLERQIDHEVIVDGDRIRSTVTVHFHNGSPIDGLSPYVLGSDGHVTETPGQNTQFVSIYSPLELIGATVDGDPATFERGSEAGLNTFSRLLTIEAMDTSVVELHLDGQRRPGRAGSPFELELWQQPTVNPDTMRTTIRSPLHRWTPVEQAGLLMQRDGSFVHSADGVAHLRTLVFSPEGR